MFIAHHTGFNGEAADRARGASAIMAAFAQLERDTMIERTRAVPVAAAANGRKGGRPRKVDRAAAAKASTPRDKGVTALDIARMLGVSGRPHIGTLPMRTS